MGGKKLKVEKWVKKKRAGKKKQLVFWDAR